MKRVLLLLLIIPCCLSVINAQETPVKPTFIGTGVFLGETPPLRDLPALTPEEVELFRIKALEKAARKVIKPREYPYSATALPKGEDEVWQKSIPLANESKAPLVNFEGQTTSSFPPDCNGTAGPNHFMQTVNVTYAIYNKTGTLLAGPTALNTLFSGVPGATQNDGDPIVLYDEQADRWFVAEFTYNLSNDYMLVAVSTTNDPTGTWYKYSFDVTNNPDYPKFGVWQDGYYMGINSTAGNDIYVFERSKMLLGQTAQMVGFDNAWRPGTGFLCVPPLDNDRSFAPTGSPGTFIAFNDDAVNGGTDQLWIYELTVNWTTPASSTFTRKQQLNVTPFDSEFTASWDDIAQPTSQKLDGVPQVIMNAPQYRNFGSYQTIVCCHTVDVDATNHAGIRWYELRRGTETTGGWYVRQHGTFAPDAHSRWMGSIMLNGSGKIGLGYSISSSTKFPSIWYCGQTAGAYANATGVLDVPEEVIYNGTVAQVSYNRWGDYALVSVDPTDDETFWFTTEYVGAGGSLKRTKIASFKIGNAPVTTTLAATSITGVSATLNGTVNPNGISTTYYFQYGLNTSYGNNTSVLSAGSGTGNVSVNAAISGLTSGIPIHYRLVATNSDGTSYGQDMVFTPGGALLTTTMALLITTNSALSGGNITSDGGSPVTARGVCWATTANPDINGNHTTDGSGTGAFPSTISGLTPNTLYHVRAYATNANGTFYGNDITFTSLCGKITTFPWNEGFENGGAIPTCWSQTQMNGSGLNWIFITGNGGSNPSTAHGGTYNACLKDNTAADNITRLITPSLDLSSLTSPQLKFWHTQQKWVNDQDQLTVYYKTSTPGTFTVLATYTSSINSWTQETINLPYATNDYYIAFEGNAKYGYGVCVDDVSITGVACTPPTAPVVGTITHPSCTVSNGSVVLSGLPASGAWTLTRTPGGTTTIGTGTSATVTGIPAGTYTYTVTNSLGCTSGASGNVVINSQPVQSPPIVGTITQPTCIITTGSVELSGLPASGTWTLTRTPGGTTTTGTGTSTTISGLSPSTYTYTVTNASGCTSVSSSNIIINAQPIPTAPVVGNITQTTCTTATGSVLLTGLPSAGTWTLTRNPGGISSNGTGTSTTISGLTPGTYSFTVTNADACTSPSSVDIVINTQPTIPNVPIVGAITQPTCTLSTGSVELSDLPASGTWTLTKIPNATTSTGTGTTSTQTGLQTGTYYYVVTNAGGCTSDTSAVIVINVPPRIPVAAQPITGLSTVCQGQDSVLYTVPPISFATTYVWTLPTGAIGTSTTRNIAVDFGTTASSGNITVKGNNECGDGTGSSLAITVNRLPTSAGNISGATIVCQGQNAVVYSVPTIGFSTSYIWSVPVGASGSSTTKNITLNYGSNAISGDITVKGRNSCGDGVPRTMAITVNPVYSNVEIHAICDGDTLKWQGQNYTTAGTYNANFQTINTCDSTYTLHLSIIPPSRTLQLKLFLEGLYSGGGLMNQARNNSGPQFGNNIADKVTVEWHDTVSPYAVRYETSNADLKTDGTVSIANIPCEVSGSYYLAIRHRNSIETWSSLPVYFGANTVTDYDFTTAASKAYGDNLTIFGSVFALWAGDENQDGIVDGTDMAAIDNSSKPPALMGYIVEDINGDGIVDGTDMAIIDNNSMSPAKGVKKP